MAKRKLDEQEIEIANKSVKRIEGEIQDLEEQANFNKLTMDFQKAQSEYQDATRPFTRKQKEIQDEKVMKMLEEQIARSKETLNNLKDQIIHGIPIKNIKEVK